MKKIMKRVLTSMTISLMICSSVGCASSTDDLVVWTFTSELEDMAEMYIEKYPDRNVVVETLPIDTLVTKLDNVINSGKNAPDIIALEEKTVRKYVESGKLENLSDISDIENMYSYTLDQARYDGDVYALTWQATPGAFYYRRSIAKNVWGDDSPEFVQSKISNWENFIIAAQELKEYNDTRILSALTEPSKVFNAQRETGWIDDNNNLVISDILYNTEVNMYDTLQQLHGGGEKSLYVNDTIEWSNGWYSDMSDNKVFGYFLASWGLHYTLKPNALNTTTNVSTEGDWGLVEGPAAFAVGGTWLAALKSSDKKDECKDFIKFITSDEEFLEDWSRTTGDFVNSKNVMNDIREGYSEPFLGGQNHYDILYDAADKLEGNHLSIYDQEISATFNDWAVYYALGDYTKNEAIRQFKLSIQQKFSSINVDV